MRSTISKMRPGDDDRDSDERILHAALELFSQDGYDATSVRAIATRAGVSAALIIHHFGSKEGLRAECDTFVSRSLVEDRDRMENPTKVQEGIEAWLRDPDKYRVVLDYTARMLIDGGEAGSALFDQMYQDTRTLVAEYTANGMMRQLDDPDMVALLIATQGLSTLVFQRHIARVLAPSMVGAATETVGTGESIDTEENAGGGLTSAILRRMVLPTIDMYTNGLYANDSILSATRAAMDTAENTTTEEIP